MPHHAIDIGRADELAASIVSRFEMISMAEAEKILGCERVAKCRRSALPAGNRTTRRRLKGS